MTKKVTVLTLKNINKAINKVGEDFERMKFNTAIATMMSLVNDFSKKGSVTKGEYKTLITLLNPVAPHMTEELWLTYGNGTSFTSAMAEI